MPDLHTELIKDWSENDHDRLEIVRKLKIAYEGKEVLFTTNRERIIVAIRSGYCKRDLAVWTLSEKTKDAQNKSVAQKKIAKKRGNISKSCAKRYLKLKRDLFPKAKPALDPEDDEEDQEEEEDEPEPEPEAAAPVVTVESLQQVVNSKNALIALKDNEIALLTAENESLRRQLSNTSSVPVTTPQQLKKRKTSSIAPSHEYDTSDHDSEYDNGD